MATTIYTIFAIFNIGIDGTLGILALKNGDKKTWGLAWGLLITAFACFAYLGSILVKDYFFMKVFASFFFSCIPLMLLLLYAYLTWHLELGNNATHRKFFSFFGALTLIDIVCELSNPFTEFVMKFTYQPQFAETWVYAPQLPYQLHLVLCYIIIGAILVDLIRATFATPSIYRHKYFAIACGLVIAVGFNAACLILQSQGMLDYSQASYSILGAILYWNEFHNKQRGMLNQVRQVILNELGTPMALFGEKNRAALCNKPMERFIADWSPRQKYQLETFLDTYGFDKKLAQAEKGTHFLWVYQEQDDKETTYQVKLTVLKDKRDNVIGRLFVFTDRSLEMDLITGFHSKSSFERRWRDESHSSKFPTSVAICDINQLSAINKKHGERMGDRCIRCLADSLRSQCPEGTYYARYNDANLLVISPGISSGELRKSIEEAKKLFAESMPELGTLSMQSAISEASEEKPSIIEAVDSAASSMRSRKLMDGTSAHSSLLDSLAQVLLESDETTEEHVRRTKDLGIELGKRLGLTDLQLSNLSLLCLLHDIGKIGIPLEILNKPGRLDKREWQVMQSHVLRGYRIANASAELQCIADSVLHHHESWNGTGYPDALSKESIPLLSRIIAVVDTYDAMTNDRPYHKAVSDAQARAELKRCAGTQFDPVIVSEFLQMLNETKPLSNEQIEEAAKEFEEQHAFRPLGASTNDAIPKDELSEDSDLVNVLKTSTYIADFNYRIVQIDETFTEITGYSEQDLNTYELTQWDLIPQSDRETYRKKVLNNQRLDQSLMIEHRILRKDGTLRNVMCIGVPSFDPISKTVYVTIRITDTDQTNAVNLTRKHERESAQRNLDVWSKLSRKDSLTGLFNHEAFVSEVENVLLQNNMRTCFIILDVDNFKEYNDTWGHLEGDRMLALVAKSLKASVREIGFAGRLGGDEFAAMLFFNDDEAQNEAAINNRVSSIFNQVTREAEATENPSSISIGAYLVQPGDNFNSAYQQADEALYESKALGRHRFTLRMEH